MVQVRMRDQNPVDRSRSVQRFRQEVAAAFWRIEGTTDNVLATYHVAERVQVSVSIDPDLIFDPDEPYTYEEPQLGRIAHHG